MTKEKARLVLQQELADHIEKWVNHKAEDGGDWHDAEIGYVHDDISIDMTKAALLVLFSISDAQAYSIKEGFLSVGQYGV